MIPLLWRALLRHPLRHPWQLGLAILGIALGVAVVLAVDLANASARRGFELAMNRVTGHATHRIVGDAQGVPEAWYARLRLEHGIRLAAPVVTGYLPRADHGGPLLQILGVDPFAEAPFRDPAAKIVGGDFDLRALLLRSDAALLPEMLGEPVTLRRGEQRFTLQRVGTLVGPEFDGLIITDLSTAQTLLGKPGLLSHIDLILPDGPAGDRQATELRARLPPELHLERADARNQATAKLSAAFALNLTAMSLLALVVGMFLIYNAISFSVVQRRALLGLLRALGVSRRELFLGILGEALLLGLAGTLLGGLLGLWLGSGLVHLVTRTINDLYYVLSVRELFLEPSSLLKAAALGLVATLAAAGLPAWEAADAPPGAALSRAHLESRWQAALPRFLVAGLALLAAGGLTLIVSHSLPVGFAGLFLLVLGCALLTPPTVVTLVQLNQPLTVRLGLLARMANRDVARHLSRTGIAVAALMVAFATTVGVGIMVDSFRGGVVIWINDLLNADFYIAPPAIEDGGDRSTALDPAVLAAVRATPGVAALSSYRALKIELDQRPIALFAVDLAPASQAGYHLIDGKPEQAWQALQSGEAVIVSEPLAYRRQLRTGDRLELPTDIGPKTFTIAAVFLDYGSEHGRILLHRSAYERYWRDPTIGSLAVFAAPGEVLTSLRDRLQQQLESIQPLVIRANRTIQQVTLEIFDRTFTITNVLRLLAILVAVVGVLSALLALQLERAREFAMLRATGMTAGEIGGLVSLQTGFMGAAAGLLALPTGILLAAVLIFVINRRAFGWSLPFQVSPSLLLETLALAICAALLAGLYPIWRMIRTRPAEALRME
ncbi:MAG TPA: ABC transporter permease [Candidatus Competibacteraceae bacterium]|nr:ABC transporter permease [Candidatus Competibacteraceae bacterium]HQD57035.1 ABC transporter permease [Candidatus Competibacteraceae bacterium]